MPIGEGQVRSLERGRWFACRVSEREGLRGTQLVRVVEVFGWESRPGESLHPRVFARVNTFWRLLHVSQLVLVPGALLLLMLKLLL